MAKRPTPPRSTAASSATTDDVSVPDADVAPPEHVEAAQAAEDAVAQTTVPPPTAETDPESEAEPAAPKMAMGAFGLGSYGGPRASSAINSSILSSVVDADVLALGLAPSESLALLDATMAQTLGMAMHNAVVRQQADRVVSQALISAACARMVERIGFAVGAAAPPKTPPPSKPAAEKAS